MTESVVAEPVTRTRRIVKKDGTVAEYKYETIKGVPVREYFRLKARKQYTPKSLKRDPKKIDLILRLHDEQIAKCVIAKTLGLSLYMVRTIINEHRSEPKPNEKQLQIPSN